MPVYDCNFCSQIDCMPTIYYYYSDSFPIPPRPAGGCRPSKLTRRGRGHRSGGARTKAVLAAWVPGRNTSQHSARRTLTSSRAPGPRSPRRPLPSQLGVVISVIFQTTPISDQGTKRRRNGPNWSERSTTGLCQATWQYPLNPELSWSPVQMPQHGRNDCGRIVQ
jgi:hypothetical protein